MNNHPARIVKSVANEANLNAVTSADIKALEAELTIRLYGILAAALSIGAIALIVRA